MSGGGTARSAALAARSMPRARRRVGWGEPSFVIALVGLAISVYLTIEHFSASTTFACPESASINCVKVTTSRWSHIGGVPVAVIGLCFFLAAAALCSPPAWAVQSLDRVRIGGAIVGVASALYLVWLELFRIDALCLWCTAVHVCTVLLLAAVLWRVTARD